MVFFFIDLTAVEISGNECRYDEYFSKFQNDEICQTYRKSFSVSIRLLDGVLGVPFSDGLRILQQSFIIGNSSTNRQLSSICRGSSSFIFICDSALFCLSSPLVFQPLPHIQRKSQDTF
jgi:hypothetical protein